MPDSNPPEKRMKFIIVTGGVLSGLGKGVVTASIGKLLQSQGHEVTVIKIDPYINVDAGTMRPTEHGEVWVTEDGGETDQDLGTYERFLGKRFSKENNITTGQVYQRIIEMERNLEFEGRCVQVIPHVPEEVERRIKRIGKKDGADFVLIEIGGTVGDYENILFLEAVRTMHLKGDPVVFVHVVYLPVLANIGEMKTKPAQHSVRMLNETGIQPDFIVTRSGIPVDRIRKEKLSLFCNVRPEQIISSPDVDLIYEIPLEFDRQDFGKAIMSRFGLGYKDSSLKEWGEMVSKIKSLKDEVNVGVVGKYFDIGDFTLEDSYISVIEAIKHACWHNGVAPKIVWIDSKEFEKNPGRLSRLNDVGGVIVPGGFGSSGVEGKIAAIRYCRENNIPFLGLCYGMQLAVVEFARNVCGMEDANSTEINCDTRNPVIDILPEQKKLIENKNYGATMRLGSYPARLKDSSFVKKIYGSDLVHERHRHRYEVFPDFIEELEKQGLVFSGVSPDRRLMEFMEIPGRRFFVATQAHPEFNSNFLKPSPLFDAFIRACRDRME